MTFKTRTCLTLHCNTCGDALDHGDYMPHYDADDTQHAFEDAEQADWVIEGDAVYCTRPDCAPTCSCDDCADDDCPGWALCPKCPRHAVTSEVTS